MHVVQIWIMHVKCLQNQVNVLKCPNEPQKIQKVNTTLLLFYVDTRNFLKAIRGNGYCFVAKGGMFPTKTITLVVRSSGLWEAYTQTSTKWDNIFTTACWCRSMIPSQVSWISNEFWICMNLKIRHLNVLPAINRALVFKIHSHFFDGT